MWSPLRQAAHPLKNQGHRFAASSVLYSKLDVLSSVAGGQSGILCSPEILDDRRYLSRRCCYYHTPSLCEMPFVGTRNLCSQTGIRQIGNENEENEDGLRELDSPAAADVHADEEEEDGDELESKVEFSVSDLLCNEMDDNGKDSEWRRPHEELLKGVLDCQRSSVKNVLNKWVEGNKLDRNGVSMIAYYLWKHRAYSKALQFSEWLESSKQLDLTEKDYALRLDMIARTRSLHKAENFIERIPESFKGELIYRTLLARCVFALNMKKAEEVFNKIRALELPLTVDACNQMIILYKRLDRWKIAQLLLLMEEESVKPSLRTFKLLMDHKGESNDIVAMEELFEKMIAEGIEPDIEALSILAKHYASAGFKVKAEAILKEMEKENLKGSLGARKALLLLNASLGKDDEVSKIWEECKLNPKMSECVAAIDAWGILGKVEEAEAVFEELLQTRNGLSSRHYTALLKVYAKHKLVTKGKELVKRMESSGCWIGPLTWDALVMLYVEAGDVAKADLVLQKAAQQKRRPLFKTYMIVMEEYAKQGDIHNTEKLFYRMKNTGYSGRISRFQVLLQAYINAKAPAYGFRERMMAENLVPNRAISGKLALVDAFRKTAVSHLLD